MTKEEKLAACKGQFYVDQFLEKEQSPLCKLHSRETFMQEIREVSKNTADGLLYGTGVPKEEFKAFKDEFCDRFMETLRFDDYPEYREIYYRVKDSGYAGKSATISVFYALVYLDLLAEKSDVTPKRMGFIQRLLHFFGKTASVSVEEAVTAAESSATVKRVYSEAALRQGFENYLIEQGYKRYTAEGAPSTVYVYMSRIDEVCTEESLNWAGLAENIDRITPQYDWGGSKEELGQKSHRTVINALLRYAEYCDTLYR